MEGAEESGSPDMSEYLDILKDRIGDNVKLIAVLDSGTLNYDTFWVTTSLRGYLAARVNVTVSTQAFHSGNGGGVIPDPSRITRILMDRLQNVLTGEVNEMFYANIPANRYTEACETA